MGGLSRPFMAAEGAGMHDFSSCHGAADMVYWK